MKYEKAVKIAKQAAKVVTDPELRFVAFNKILEHLLKRKRKIGGYDNTKLRKALEEIMTNGCVCGCKNTASIAGKALETK